MTQAIVILPLIAAILAGLVFRQSNYKIAQYITTACVSLAAILSWVTLFNVVGGQPINATILSWISSGSLDISWQVNIDVLTAIMLIVVNTVSALVHMYSIGYMSHDPHRQRFMAYLSLFTFFMLVLVTSGNFLQLFVGWEGVGLSSYLLIGFWFKKQTANAAAIKAFVVNRVGDFGLIVGIFLIYLNFGSLDFDTVFNTAPLIAGQTTNIFGGEFDTITLICIFLFIGCMGKSAQLGLHTWLPDAMEGPTPVSALIHAATMVTAGVFLVARCSPLFELAPDALALIAFIGATTAVFAATIGITQNDIKKVIAYSTCSQLGYMFFACGVSAYPAAIFHLMTHAFFKALLFLGAGSVIHAMHDEQDLRKMGGIWRKIPFTYATMWIGSLALAGVPFFAGYYSKDMILESAFASNVAFANYAYWMGIVAAFCTAFYSWRLIIMAFHGDCRNTAQVFKGVHESPKIMTIPLFILAIGAVLAGYLGYKAGMVDATLEFWQGSIVINPANNVLEDAHNIPFIYKKMPLLVGIVAIAFAYLVYMFRQSLAAAIASAIRPLYNLSANKYYVDEIYDYLFVKPAKWLGRVYWLAVDVSTIDKFGPNGFANLTKRFAGAVSKLHSGYLYHYIFVIVAGLAVLFGGYLILTGRLVF